MPPPARPAAGLPAGFLSLAALFAPAASAGLRDTDTRWQARRAAPGTLELIVGKFARHTDEFYERRAADRRSRLRLHAAGERPLSPERRAAAYDDLAVALHKLGRPDEALEALDRKVADVGAVGRFQTAANRGTILVHVGRLEEGRAEIERALAIPSDAPRDAGPERVEKALIDYLLARRGDAGAVPAPLAPAGGGRTGFAAFLAGRGVAAAEGRAGVEALLRFGDHRSPALLEALGDLLAAGDEPARRLAARAYLAAGRGAPGAADAYRDLAAAALPVPRGGDRRGGADAVAQTLDREFAETDAWFEKLRADEALWIRESLDPDVRFRQKYGIATLRVGDTTGRPARIQDQWSADAKHWPLDAAIGAGGAVTIAAVWGLIALRRRRPNGWERD